MNRGYVKLWRKSLDAGWLQNHKLWTFWTYCLMKANHRENFKVIVRNQEIILQPGQFIFGRKVAADETGLTEREIRTVLAFLANAGNLTIRTTNRFSIITIVNWPIYQSSESENDQQNDQQTTSKRPRTRTQAHEKKPAAEISKQISSLSERYDPDILSQAFAAISSIRKSNRIADTVKLSILDSWKQYQTEAVIAGINTYLEKNYAKQGKGEKYLMGIIRNNGSLQDRESTGGQVMKSTGSASLDEYYRQQGIRII